MKKWTLVDQSFTPDGSVVSLHEHDGSYTIRVGAVPLMSTRQHASEETLARVACEHVQGKSGARILIGGLGFGFTLKAALAQVRADAIIVVCEILSAVIEWNRNASLPFSASAMADPRVVVLHRDVSDLIAESRAAFDSVILDVDNGPTALTTAGNARLYDLNGLQLVVQALRPGGRVAFWSASSDSSFEKRMRRAGFDVDVRRCRSHRIFLGRIPLLYS